MKPVFVVTSYDIHKEHLQLESLVMKITPEGQPELGRIMPPRWFFGNAGNQLLYTLLPLPRERQRPLAEGERILGAFVLPPFQRQAVWTIDQKIRLIESIYMGLPIGSLIYNLADGPTDGWLLDGQQRLTAILDFINGNFAVNGWMFPDLPEIEQRHFYRMNISMIETQIIDPALCEDLYNRLAYGGTSHA